MSFCRAKSTSRSPSSLHSETNVSAPVRVVCRLIRIDSLRCAREHLRIAVRVHVRQSQRPVSDTAILFLFRVPPSVVIGLSGVMLLATRSLIPAPPGRRCTR
ncbi:hypothetical protein C8R45DRAFT_1104541 [Mycena sanguinolenta]|nr:hypothetical protein C8R45DRAFT_1104541 [Mycena sanguinolenta]